MPSACKPLEPREVRAHDPLLLVGHGLGEALTRCVEEHHPLGQRLTRRCTARRRRATAQGADRPPAAGAASPPSACRAAAGRVRRPSPRPTGRARARAGAMSASLGPGCSRASRPHSLMASSRVMDRAYAVRRSPSATNGVHAAGQRAPASWTPRGAAGAAVPAAPRARHVGEAAVEPVAQLVRVVLARARGACAPRPRPSAATPAIPASPTSFQGTRIGRVGYGRARATALPLAEAVATAATGDIWLFRGRSLADRAIQTVTNSPVNHVGMVVALDDLPPLLWHAELGHSLPGRLERQAPARRAAARARARRSRPGASRYGQRAWTRLLEGTLERRARGPADAT